MIFFCYHILAIVHDLASPVPVAGVGLYGELVLASWRRYRVDVFETIKRAYYVTYSYL